jgi:transcription initiation factor TFIIIB Brf1 subunit/transcription initiation factor TFIIB
MPRKTYRQDRSLSIPAHQKTEDIMNKDQRKVLGDVTKDLMEAKGLIDRIEWSKIQSVLEDAKSTLEAAKETEEEAFENLSDNLKQSERGEKINAAVENLEQAISDIEELLNKVEEVESWSGTLDVIIASIEEAGA